MISKKTAKITTGAILAGAVALAIAGGMSGAEAAKEGKEKCYGVVKAGHNDCANAAGTHSCAGNAKTDADGGEWTALPKGVCDKLVGGSLTPVESTDKHDEDHG